MHDFDQREMFYMYLSPGDVQNKKVCTITVNLVCVRILNCLFILTCVPTQYVGIQKGHNIHY